MSHWGYVHDEHSHAAAAAAAAAGGGGGDAGGGDAGGGGDGGGGDDDDYDDDDDDYNKQWASAARYNCVSWQVQAKVMNTVSVQVSTDHIPGVKSLRGVQKSRSPGRPGDYIVYIEAM